MRVALHTRLREGTADAYEEAHRKVPPALLSAIRGAGVSRWTIWRSDLELFHLIECDDYEKALEALANLPVNVAWQSRMEEFLEVPHDYDSAGDALAIAWELP
ncbi:MAG: L-rhamnose mutarotase [Actinobacteria bacterium]|nr:L-rhamnose mutarotase [Actinomycetota bacterium]